MLSKYVKTNPKQAADTDCGMIFITGIEYTILNLKISVMQRKGLGLLLAAAAAYGAYRYSKMTPAQKSDLKQKGKDFVDKNLGGMKNMFGKKSTVANGNGY